MTDTYDYEAFGDLLNQTGFTENNYRFTGEQYDPNLDQYYLRARYYNQNIGRFTQMDTFQGVGSDPITLHKYLYANADPVNNIDPSGNFSLVSFAVAQDIRSTLSGIQVDVGSSLLNAALDPDSAASNTAISAALFSIGVSGVKLTKLLARKVASRCGGAGTNCIRALLGRIKTPHGVAKQLNSAEAWAALEKAQSGATLYRLGKLGRSNAADAQFWSLIDPRTLNSNDFARIFGIPRENANFDFMIAGRLAAGKPAITRIAPAAPGASGGGAIEVVTNPRSVIIEFFHSF